VTVLLLEMANPLKGVVKDAARRSTDVADAGDEDEALVERFRRGDRRAFEELVRRYQRPVYYFLRRFVKDDDEAKDIAQRAFVKAYQGIDGLRGFGAFKSWLYRIASNLALNHLRDRAREQPSEDAGAELAVDAIGASRMTEAEEYGQLREAIADLPPKQRLVLELRVFEELSFKEVAEAAGCTENAAKVNFHHAVKRLRSCVGHLQDGETSGKKP
jgi:RNA polymerase sigma-70 factor (ECF subfamily)